MPTSTTDIHTLLLSFQHPLFPRQIPLWRGAFIELAGWETDLLHNHQPTEAADQFLHRYPLVQYRTYRGHAALFALNEGIEAVQQVLFSKKWEINWKGKPTGLILDQQPQRKSHTLSIGVKRRYQLHHYLALNADNYQLWLNCANLVERAQLLERILRGHLLSCLWGLGWTGSEQLEVQLQEIRQTTTLPYHGQDLMAFDLIFDANVDLPPGIALGKAVSHGFGVLFEVVPNAKTTAGKKAQPKGQDLLLEV